MRRPFSYYLSELDAIYCDRPYFVGVTARLLAGFCLLLLLVVFPLNFVKLLVLHPPYWEARLAVMAVFELACLLTLRLVFKGRLELAGSALAITLLVPTLSLILIAGIYPEPLAVAITMATFGCVFILMAIVFASRRIAVALLVFVVVCQIFFFYRTLNRPPIAGSIAFASGTLLREGVAAICMVFFLGLMLRHMMQKTHERSEEALRQTRAVNENLEKTVGERTRELVRLNEALKQLNEEKNVFMGMAAHDLRSPASTIRMITESIECEGDYSKPRVQEDLAAIASTATRMLSLLDDLLDVNAIEEGKLLLHPEALDARALLCDVYADFRPRAAAKGLELLLLPLPEALPLMADAAAIRQVLENLVSNALKFSPAGKRVWLAAESTTGGRVRIAVRDEGPGLSEADRGKLFGKFSRLSAQPTGGETSNGLGLSIVKRLVEGMAGTIEVESIPGRGATFRAEFPAA